MAQNRLLEDYVRLREIERLIAATELELIEIEEALKLLDQRPRRVFRVFAGRIMAEVSVDEARRFLEEERAKLVARLESLRREAKELRARVERARQGLLG